MLTEEERQKLIEEVGLDEWDPSVWEVTDRGAVYRITVAEDQVPKLVGRARDMGKTADEYLSGLIGAILATA